MVSRASTGHTSAGIIHETQAAQLTHRFVYESDVVVLRHLLAVANSLAREVETRRRSGFPWDEYLQPRGVPREFTVFPGAGSKFAGTSNGHGEADCFIARRSCSTTARASVHPTTRRRLAMMRFARVLPREVQSFTRRRAPEEPEAITFVSIRQQV